MSWHANEERSGTLGAVGICLVYDVMDRRSWEELEVWRRDVETAAPDALVRHPFGATRTLQNQSESRSQSCKLRHGDVAKVPPSRIEDKSRLAQVAKRASHFDAQKKQRR